MPELKIIDGRLSPRYNHFSEYKFMSCLATDTRLMGVVALKITWQGREKPRSRFYQIVHLDFSEYGVDEYLEFECIPGTKKYSENKEDMNHYWDHFVSVMGGDIVEIRPEVLLRLIERATPLAAEGADREYDDYTNEEFRKYALMRFGLMRDELIAEGYDPEACSVRSAAAAVSVDKLATCDTINYFIMRLIDHDYDAASLLTTISREELMANPLGDAGIQTLVKSSIKRSNIKTDPPADGTSYPYRCKITTLGRKGYYHATFVIYLDKDYRSKNPLVTQIEIGSILKLSEYESAIQVVQKEYITVFKCPDEVVDNFNGNFILPLQGVEPTYVPNGCLYTVYKKDNSHVNKADYSLGDDVVGYVLLAVGGELILMSNSVNNITSLDNAVLFSYYSPQLQIQGRYLLEKTPVFQTLCQNYGVLFEDLIEPQ